MSNFTQIVRSNVFKALNEYKMLENTDEIIVGFSGGADSVCLLHILYSLKSEIGYSLKAVHINHGIRGDEAERDEKFAEQFCLKYGIPFQAFKFKCIEEAEESKETLEECGRRLRYKSFNEACGGKSKIATAHNANDNAETIIFNITRGTSVKGVSGIPFVRDNIIRPLLYCSRNEIEGYCRENELDYVTDSTNSEVDFTRNKIRHLILPVLEEINPSYISSFNGLSDNARLVADYLTKNTEQLICKAKIGEFIYSREALLNADKAIVFELFCTEFNKYTNLILDRKKVCILYDLLIIGGRLQLYGNIFAEVKKAYFRFYQVYESISEDIITIDTIPFEKQMGNYIIKLEKNYNYSKIVNQIDAGDMIDCNTVSGNLVLRTRKSGDFFTFPRRNVTKTLKKLFTEENIPIETRSQLPVIADDSGVVWVFGFGVTKRCLPSENSDNIVLIRGENNDK